PVTNTLLTFGVPLARPLGRLEDKKGNPVQLTRPEETALAMSRGFQRRAELEQAVRRSDYASGDFDRIVKRLDRAKELGQADITNRARRMAKRGEQLTPQRLVISKKLVDDLYSTYLASAERQ